MLFPGAFLPFFIRSALSCCRAASPVTSQRLLETSTGCTPWNNTSAHSRVTFNSALLPKPFTHANLLCGLRKAEVQLGRTPSCSLLLSAAADRTIDRPSEPRAPQRCLSRAGQRSSGVRSRRDGEQSPGVAPCSALTSSGTIPLKHLTPSRKEQGSMEQPFVCMIVCFIARNAAKGFVAGERRKSLHEQGERTLGSNFYLSHQIWTSFCCQVEGLFAAAVTNISFTVTSWLTPLNESQLWHNPKRS